jgi:hypothetical protein
MKIVIDLELGGSFKESGSPFQSWMIYRNIHSQVFVIETFMASMTSESEF